LRAVVSHEVFDQDRYKLLSTVEKLERRARIFAATVRLLLALLRASCFRLAGERLPQGATSILRAVTSAHSALPLALILRILGMQHNTKMPHTRSGYPVYPPRSQGITRPFGSRDEGRRAPMSR
jgi:hypothetical protein